ncbi:unnamed protein product [Didymodactylos carnosus]|uniref:Phospholipid/glycerol acyltransferase domain-containing protein n=1 Tax=Didymodactylos carnosus TaxID=1234261 RepID=A0A814QDC8_9BILA|nr:unnamed protein product [Didymodactylos carnosus]CAF1117102.1 unnamed protein product [Didymodactylos carnosus]CAF3805980.1 unnamed protein product [Didymodactylos carnosus]CAF3880955.1 unnamed protein product [Didymodactylos carnosus]
MIISTVPDIKLRLVHLLFFLLQTMASAAQILTVITILCLPMITIGSLVLLLAALNKSIGVRKVYVKILAFIFDYATRIKRNKEITIDPEASTSATDDPPDKERLVKEPVIEKSEDGLINEDTTIIASPTAKSSSNSSQETNANQQQESDKLRQRRGQKTTADETDLEKSTGSTGQGVQFKLGDIMDYTRQGLEAIVDDEVTKRFTSAEEMAVWNLLTRTQQSHELFSLRVSLLWFLGFIVRYCILFPFRLCLFCLAIFWMMASALFLKYFPNPDTKLRIGFYVNLVLHRILSRVFSAIITFHNLENRAKRGSICVANHTSPIDVIILSTDNGFSMIGQQHGGFFGLVQRTLSHTAKHIWFERAEAKDRHMVTEKMTEHVSNKQNLPILIFPEGTCINNTSVMMFKKGCFEITEAPIYPVAIKYDNRFGDAFWNSSKHELFQYLILMMTSWAIVVDVYYLEPMKIEEGETSIDFARRVKAAIAKQGGFVDLDWDGGLKRTKPKADFKAEEQRKFYETLKTE